MRVAAAAALCEVGDFDGKRGMRDVTVGTLGALAPFGSIACIKCAGPRPRRAAVRLRYREPCG